MLISDWSSDVCSSDLLTFLFEPAAPIHRTILSCEAHRNFVSEIERYGEQVGEEIRGLVQFGATIAESDYFNAQNLAQGLRSEADKFFSNCDIVLMPSSPGAAPDRKSTRLNSSH